MTDETMTQKIRAQLDAAPVVLFMKGTPDFPQCGFSAQTAGALRALKANYRHVNIFEEPELREALKAYSSWPTYPQLYVKGELIGGCDIVTEMYRSGELKTPAAGSRRGQLTRPLRSLRRGLQQRVRRLGVGRGR